MNASYLRTLKSMVWLENKSEFNSSTYTYDSSHLSYPQNVVVVASPTSKGPPPVDGEVRFKSFTEALSSLSKYIKFGKTDGVSILVHEGLYINPFLQVHIKSLPQNFTIEIVGIKNVRFLISLQQTFQATSTCKISLRNILIHGRACHNLVLSGNAEFFFDDIKISTPQGIGIISLNGCYLILRNCLFQNCFHCIYCTNANAFVSASKFKECSGTFIGQVHGSGSINVVDSEFYFSQKNSGYCILLSENCMADLQRCKLIGNPFSSSAICARSAVVSIADSFFDDFKRAVDLTQRGAKAKLIQCEFGSRILTVVKCQYNVDVYLERNIFHGKDLVEMVASTGEIKLLNNRSMIRGPHSISRDHLCSIPMHDFKVHEMKVITKNSEFPHICDHHKRSDLIRKYRSGMKLPTRNVPIPLYCYWCYHDLIGPNLVYCQGCIQKVYCSKVCQELDWVRHKPLCESQYSEHLPFVWYCYKCHDDKKREKKQMYCKNCMKVVYCSKDCQVADWPDHKIICESLRDCVFCKECRKKTKKKKAHKN